MRNKIRVLVVDDSALVRQILSRGLDMDPSLEVVGTATDPYMARDRILELRPDVLTLDVEMPRMDGVEFLRRLMPQYPLPVVMVSSLTQRGKQITIEALDAGAVDFVSKPTTNMAQGLAGMMQELRTKIKIASTANVAHWKSKRPQPPARPVAGGRALAESTDKVIAVGASTGGTEALRKVLVCLPAMTPGIVVVQHMPAGFTKMFADRLNQLCAMEVREAQSGDRVAPGRVLIAPGGLHMKIRRSGGIYQVDCEQGPLVSGHCPSVNVMMHSVAEHVGGNALGVMLTGMGADGAEGMLAMKQAGARNLAQDEATSVVFGMPKVAYDKGAVEKLLPVDQMAREMVSILSESP